MNALQASALWTSDTVFAKTAKGQEEVSRRVHGLDVRQRRVLIVIDGQRSAGAVASILAADDVGQIIPSLAEQGFIAQKNTGPLPVALPGENPMESEDALRDAKEFMISVAHSCLGLLAADLITRIERVERTAQLPPVVGYWAAAIRDSRFGKHLGERYLDQLKKALPALQLR